MTEGFFVFKVLNCSFDKVRVFVIISFNWSRSCFAKRSRKRCALLAFGYDNENSYTSQMHMCASTDLNNFLYANGSKRRMVRTIKYFADSNVAGATGKNKFPCRDGAKRRITAIGRVLASQKVSRKRCALLIFWCTAIFVPSF